MTISQRWIESLRSAEPTARPTTANPCRLENPPDASSLPSGENASAVAEPLCPRSSRICWHATPKL